MCARVHIPVQKPDVVRTTFLVEHKQTKKKKYMKTCTVDDLNVPIDRYSDHHTGGIVQKLGENALRLRPFVFSSVHAT